MSSPMILAIIGSPWSPSTRPPILNLISTRSRKVVGRVTLAAATDGAEQSAYVPATGLLYR